MHQRAGFNPNAPLLGTSSFAKTIKQSLIDSDIIPAEDDNGHADRMKTKTRTKLDKLDLYQLHKSDYATPRKPVILEIKPAVYLAIDGKGPPGGDIFTAKIGALYAVAFTVKMTRKFAGQQDYAVCKLEALWWSGAAGNFAQAPKEEWEWRLLIRTPEFVTREELDNAVRVLLKRGKPEDVKQVRLEPLQEGTCVQMLHVGPYEKEGETVALMKAVAEREGFQLTGRHHEVYLSDPRRVAPERLKTILRVPLSRGT
jgi:hypothetical protein